VERVELAARRRQLCDLGLDLGALRRANVGQVELGIEGANVADSATVAASAERYLAWLLWLYRIPEFAWKAGGGRTMSLPILRYNPPVPSRKGVLSGAMGMPRRR
jgi:hypothetical protein